MPNTVGLRIESLAKAKGLAQGAGLAQLFGVTYETLRKWRSGDSAPNRARQVVIAQVLGCKPSVFMHGTGPNIQQEPDGLEPWPFESITPHEWVSDITERERGVVEQAARDAMDRILADKKERAASAKASSRKPRAAA